MPWAIAKLFLWYKRFKEGRTFVDDDERSGRPSTSTTAENIAEVREAILAERRQKYPRCLWDSRTVIRDRWTHSGGQFEHETHFCEICAKTAERQPECPSRFCLQGTQTTSQSRPQLHLQHHNRWWNMSVWLWPWD